MYRIFMTILFVVHALVLSAFAQLPKTNLTPLPEELVSAVDSGAKVILIPLPQFRGGWNNLIEGAGIRADHNYTFVAGLATADTTVPAVDAYGRRIPERDVKSGSWEGQLQKLSKLAGARATAAQNRFGGRWYSQVVGSPSERGLYFVFVLKPVPPETPTIKPEFSVNKIWLKIGEPLELANQLKAFVPGINYLVSPKKGATLLPGGRLTFDKPGTYRVVALIRRPDAALGQNGTVLASASNQIFKRWTVEERALTEKYFITEMTVRVIDPESSSVPGIRLSFRTSGSSLWSRSRSYTGEIALRAALTNGLYGQVGYRHLLDSTRPYVLAVNGGKEWSWKSLALETSNIWTIESNYHTVGPRVAIKFNPWSEKKFSIFLQSSLTAPYFFHKKALRGEQRPEGTEITNGPIGRDGWRRRVVGMEVGLHLKLN